MVGLCGIMWLETMGGESMVLWRHRYQGSSIFIGVMAVILVQIGFLFNVYASGPQAFLPVYGMAFVWASLHGRRTYAPLLWGAFLGQFSIRMFVFEQPFIEAAVASVLLSGTLILVVELLIRGGRRGDYLNLYNRFFQCLLLKAVGILLLMSAVGASMHAFTYFILDFTDGNVGFDWLTFFIGIFFSVLLLAPLGLIAQHFDPKDIRIEKPLEAVPLLVFSVSYILVMVLFTNHIGPFDFASNYYMLLLFYVLIGVLYHFRTIVFFSLTMLVGASLYVRAHPVEPSLLGFYANLLVFTVVAHGMTFGIRRHKHMREGQLQQITEKNKQVDRLIDDVYELLRFSKDMIRDSEGTSLTEEFSRALDIAKRLVGGAKAGYCYVEEDGKITMLRADVYKTTQVPFLYECHDVANKAVEAVSFLHNIKASLATLYGQAFMALHEKAPVKSRALIRFQLTNDLSYTIGVDKTDESGFSPLEIANIKRFAHLFQSLFMRNHLAAQSNRLKNEIAISFVRTLELFDAYTKGHSEDVAELTSQIASALGIPEQDREELYWAGLLHDVGKVGVSSSTLNKKGSLTAEEYDAVKAHVHYGFDTVSSQRDLRRIALVIRHHHEWHNGEGYPNGLAGDDIPLGGRIIAVADAITTMATNRAYRRRMAKDAIIEEIKRHRGTQFCPEVTDAAVKLLEDGWLESHYQRSY